MSNANPRVYLSPSSQEANLVRYPEFTYVEENAMNDIADLIVPELQRHGIEVMRNNRTHDFRKHIEESNAFDADLHLAIHSNAVAWTPNLDVRGRQLYVYRPGNPSAKGTVFAHILSKHLETISPFPPRGGDNGVMDGSKTLSEVSKTTAPACLVEVDFHDNKEGALWIVQNKAAIAHAHVLAVLEFFGIAWIDPKPPEPEPTPDPVEDTDYPWYPEKAQPGKIFRVQIGAFDTRAQAEAHARLAKEKGFPVYIRYENL